MIDKPESTSALRKLLLVGFLLLFNSVLIFFEGLFSVSLEIDLPELLLTFMAWEKDHHQIVLHAVNLIVALLLYRVFIWQSWLKTEALVTKGKFVPPWPYLVFAGLIVAADLAGSILLGDRLRKDIQFLWQMDTAGISTKVVASIMGAMFGALTSHSLWQKIFIRRSLAANVACVMLPTAITSILIITLISIVPRSTFGNGQSLQQILLPSIVFTVTFLASAAWSAVLYKKEGNLPWIMILTFLCALL